MKKKEPIGLHVRYFSDRTLALGLAVEYLMNKPAFARLRFGDWSRVLTGQARRSHCFFVCTDKKVFGFCGWAIMPEEAAEAWAAGDRNSLEAPGDKGDCVVINAWAADTPEANRMILVEALRSSKKYKMLYARREYPNGRSRLLKWPIAELMQSEAIMALGMTFPSSKPTRQLEP
jgi:hemolysin-activating ACP:hemolysin acyltransferase